MFREILLKELEHVGDGVGVFLSSGVDSSAALLALLELGKKPTAYSFFLNGKASMDALYARANAKKLNVTFVPVILPSDLSTLISDVRRLIFHYGLHSKAAIECAWPMMYALDVVEQEHVVTGSAADGHFGLSKKAMMHYRYPQEKFDAFRENYFSDEDRAQVATVRRMGKERGIAVHAPYFCEAMISHFLGRSWDELNRPRQKEPIRAAFPKLQELKIRNHTNLQLGDSGIAEHFRSLLNTSLNVHNWKSPVGIYNAIARGQV